jgi:Domain of unknown function (DUF4276)
MAIRRFTLLAEGPTDEALLPILHWLWQHHFPRTPVVGQFADFEYSSLASHRVVDRIAPALKLYPCDVLFIHRDADREPITNRVKEIHDALARVHSLTPAPAVVCVVPVRMSEAWMLFDEAAIRKAAENPNGQIPLSLPKPSRIETLPDPKTTLYELLKTASGLPPQRLRRFQERRAARLVTQFITDFAPLRQLPAFRHLEEEFSRLPGS